MPSFAAIRQDEYPATDELQCIAVHIPAGDEYKALLAGFIAFLTDTRSYEDPDSAQADGIAAVFDEGYAQTNWDGCGVPPECVHLDSEVNLSPATMQVANGNAIFIAFTANGQRNNCAFGQSPGIDQQVIFTTRFMAPGAWEYRITGVRRNSSGIMKMMLYNAPSTLYATKTHDFYVAGADQFNQVFTGTFSNPSDAETIIEIKTDGKNASSSGYTTFITLIEMWRVA